MRKKVNYGPRRCDICGREYIPKRSNQRCCLDPECKRKLQQLDYREYRQKNYARVLEASRRSMEKKREQQRQIERRKPDTIIAIGYAERQMAETLKKVGRVNTEL